MRILMVVHGYPPRERAGTERHAELLARALAARGHAVHVLAATRAPGRRPYEVLREPGVTRIVVHRPARPLAQAERDRAVEAAARRVEAAFRPDVVHLQHVQFLSSGLRFRAPVVATLHDAWAWCPAGGMLLRQPSGEPCPGPEPARCAPCTAAWRPTPGRAERALEAAAGLLAPLVPPERLHALYRRLPPALRVRPRRGAAPPEPPAAAEARNAALRALYRRAAARIAPSRFLAGLAEAQGIGPVEVVPHGVAEAAHPRVGGGPLLFLGTIARHKGPDLVVEAWRRAFPAGDPPLALHGPVIEPGLVAGHPVGPVLDDDGVSRALAGARALVLGSRWPENAPLVVLEARAHGCPVVAPRSGGIPELVREGRDGLLYRPGDVDDLAVALRRVAADPPGPSRPPPTPEEMARRTEAVYERAREGA